MPAMSKYLLLAYRRNFPRCSGQPLDPLLSKRLSSFECLSSMAFLFLPLLPMSPLPPPENLTRTHFASPEVTSTTSVIRNLIFFLKKLCTSCERDYGSVYMSSISGKSECCKMVEDEHRTDRSMSLVRVWRKNNESIVMDIGRANARQKSPQQFSILLSCNWPEHLDLVAVIRINGALFLPLLHFHTLPKDPSTKILGKKNSRQVQKTDIQSETRSPPLPEHRRRWGEWRSHRSPLRSRWNPRT